MRARVAVIVATATLLFGCTHADRVATVERIIDGDTIDVRIGGRTERVRLIGIDTPEIAHPDSPAECFGPEATDFTAALVPVGTEVRLERDIVPRDDYGRLLAYVFVGDVHVNVEIARAGFATPLSIPPNDTFARTIASAAHDAMTAGRGLWAVCTP